MGVNDLGSLMLEENVVNAAGTHFEYTKEHLRGLCEELGFELRQRDFFYREYARPAAVKRAMEEAMGILH